MRLTTARRSANRAVSLSATAVRRGRWPTTTSPCCRWRRMMQHAWAALFAARCAPGGGWDSLTSSRAMWKDLRTFAGFLAARDQPPEDIAGLTVAVWNAWRISRRQNTSGRNQILKTAAFLRPDAHLPEPVREAMARRLPRVSKAVTAFTPDEFRQLRLAALRMFRAAHLRIRENTELLHQWRAGWHGARFSPVAHRRGPGLPSADRRCSPVRGIRRESPQSDLALPVGSGWRQRRRYLGTAVSQPHGGGRSGRAPGGRSRAELHHRVRVARSSRDS